MPDYEITFARSARKDLENLPSVVAERVTRRIEQLSHNPRSYGAIKLHGQDNFWRVRVGDYRVIYEIFDSTKTIDIAFIRHRKDVYRNL